MHLALRDILVDEGRGAGKEVLTVGHSVDLLSVLGIGNANVTEANYPEHSITDLRAFPPAVFDYVISDQVLEHVEGSPQHAFDSSLRVLKPGGIAVHTTCFINPIHGHPGDFWRFTPAGLRYLARGFSEVITAAGWGNRAVWIIEALGLRYFPVPHAKWCPLRIIATRDNPLWPVTTWIVARK